MVTASLPRIIPGKAVCLGYFGSWMNQSLTTRAIQVRRRRSVQSKCLLHVFSFPYASSNVRITSSHTDRERGTVKHVRQTTQLRTIAPSKGTRDYRPAPHHHLDTKCADVCLPSPCLLMGWCATSWELLSVRSSRILHTTKTSRQDKTANKDEVMACPETI